MQLCYMRQLQCLAACAAPLLPQLGKECWKRLHDAAVVPFERMCFVLGTPVCLLAGWGPNVAILVL